MTYPEFFTEWMKADEWIGCHTSGSTGAPSRIMLPRKEMRRSALRTLDFFSLRPGSHLHSCISADFIGGKMMAVRSIVGGCTLTFEEPSNRPLSDYCEGEYRDRKIDLLSVVPSQMLHILNHRERLPEIGDILVGGGSVNASLRKRISDSGLRVWESYGMTETSSHVALRRIGEPEEPFRPLEGIAVSLTPDCRIRIHIEGWQDLETNDIGEVYGDGTFRILGRADNVIVTGGMKVHPEQVEDTLEPLLGCRALVFGEEDEKWGRRVVMRLEGCTKSDEEAMAICRRSLPSWSVPKRVERGAIKMTANGKKKRQNYKND